jgi:hypothetical protein
MEIDRDQWVKLRERLPDILFYLGHWNPEVRAEAAYRLAHELDRHKLGWDDIADVIFRFGPLYKQQIDEAIEACRKLLSETQYDRDRWPNGVDQYYREFLDVARQLDWLDDKQKRLLARICLKLEVRWP